MLAELPAMIPMCPPGIRNSSVSVLLTFDRIGSDWHGGDVIAFGDHAGTCSRRFISRLLDHLVLALADFVAR